MTPGIVFDLWHIYEKSPGEDEEKHIGIYSSPEKAQQAIARLKDQPGFRLYPNGFEIFEVTLDRDGWTEGFVAWDPPDAMIYKIVPRGEWEAASGDYHGSAHDRADGFLHFSTAAQLAETLRLYYAGQEDLMLVAVDAAALGTALKWERSASRNEDFPHLYGALSCDAMKWARPIARGADGSFALPDLN